MRIEVCDSFPLREGGVVIIPLSNVANLSMGFLRVTASSFSRALRSMAKKWICDAIWAAQTFVPLRERFFNAKFQIVTSRVSGTLWHGLIDANRVHTPSEVVRDRVDCAALKLGERRFHVLPPGAGCPEKQWSAEQFVAAGHSLQQRSLAIGKTESPAQKDRCECIALTIPGARAIVDRIGRQLSL